MTELDLRALSPRNRYKLAIGSVIPRPIAWVSTQNEHGIKNVAPFSFFSVVCEDPLILMISVMRYKKDDVLKDTAHNILQTKEAVVHIVPFSCAQAMNISSSAVSEAVDEFELAGITPESAVCVAADRIAEAPIAFECVLHQHISVGEDAGGADTFFLEAIHARFHDGVMEDFRIFHEKLDPLARLAGNFYARLGDIESGLLLEMKRP